MDITSVCGNRLQAGNTLTNMKASLCHVSDKHPHQILDVLNILRKRQELWDVAIVVGTLKLYAHRVVLAAASPYFHAMFTVELAESHQTEIIIRDIEEKAMELLIDFAYTAQITVEEGNVQSLLPAACLLQMVEIQEICSEFLKRQLDPTNCLGIRAVLQHVRLPLLTPKFLVGVVSVDPFIHSDEQCRDLIDEAKNYMLLPQERPLMQGPRTRPRRPITREVLFAVGGWCSGDAISSVERYCPESREWRLVAPMSKRRCGVGVSVLDDLLYAVGGHDGNSYLNSVERYDPQINQWSSDVQPTSTCRTSVGVAVLDGYLYAVGGQDGMSCLDIVERYNPKQNRWSKVSSMNIKRLGVAVAVLGGYLYAVGGSDGQTPWNLVERYDPKENRWVEMSPMSTRRKHLGCTVYRDMLYAVGGRDDTTELNSVEKYNPLTDTWSTVVAMNSRRSGVGLAVVNGQLMAVGGFDGTSYLKTIEIYTPEANTWRMYDGMHYRRLGGGVGVIRL
uniref:Kelch-like protein 20 n=1 Tax=Ciona savignyi TaxID=51511 RepID=H2Z133_CIOSA